MCAAPAPMEDSLAPWRLDVCVLVETGECWRELCGKSHFFTIEASFSGSRKKTHRPALLQNTRITPECMMDRCNPSWSQCECCGCVASESPEKRLPLGAHNSGAQWALVESGMAVPKQSPTCNPSPAIGQFETEIAR